MPSEPSHEAFELPIRIGEEDIDVLDHVNNVVYVRWVQDAATAHWMRAATPAQQADVLWVVARHEIDYRRSARLGDEILARTWVGTATRFAFDRHTEILRAGDRTLLARARTVWCPIDPSTSRPTAVDEELRRMFSVPDEEAAWRHRTAEPGVG